MKVEDIVNVAYSEVVEIKAEDIDSDPEDFIEQRKCPSNGQNLNKLNFKEPHSRKTNNYVHINDRSRNVAISETVDDKLQHIKSDPEESLQQVQECLLKTNKSVDINASNTNLTSYEAVEIKLEDIDADPENSSEQLEGLYLNTLELLKVVDRDPNYNTSNKNAVNLPKNNRNEAEFQYICNTINEDLQVLNLHGIIEQQSRPNENREKIINSTQIQVCIDLTESDHDDVPTYEITEKSSNANINIANLTILSLPIQTVQIINPLFVLTRNDDKEKIDNLITAKPVIKKPKIVRQFHVTTASKEIGNKYFCDRSVHDDEIIMRPLGYACAYCLYYSSLWLHIKHHIKFKHRDLAVKKKKAIRPPCPNCLQQVANIRRHISSCRRVFTVKDTDWPQCANCDFKATTKSILKRHIHRRHPVTPEDELKCEDCGKYFKGRDSLSSHRRKTHRSKPLKCSSCDFTTLVDYALWKHRLVHKDPGEVFKCTSCDFHSQYFNAMVRHKKKEHPKWQQCHLCPYRARNSQMLKLHLIHHQDKKNEEVLTYRCKECDYKTYRSYNLQIHMLNHKKPEEIEMFYCHHCDFNTKRKGNLKAHIFRHDIYRSILSCFICDFKTRSQRELTKHIDVHSEIQRNETCSTRVHK